MWYSSIVWRVSVRQMWYLSIVWRVCVRQMWYLEDVVSVVSEKCPGVQWLSLLENQCCTLPGRRACARTQCHTPGREGGV